MARKETVWCRIFLKSVQIRNHTLNFQSQEVFTTDKLSKI